MISGVRSSFWVLVGLCVACGGGEPQVVTPPPLHITATPPKAPPQAARWIFSHPERGLVAKLDLGDGRTLYIGQNGRREVAKGTDPLMSAPQLAIGDLVGVVRDPKGEFAFLASDGNVFVSKDPLGSLDTVRPGPIGTDKPNAHFTSPTTGKAAMMGIHPDGRVMRSADFGATWSPVDYAGGSKPYGHAGAVAMDSKGNGILLHFPQRLFVTHDDGATWAPLASLHIGARTLAHDGLDRLFVTGFGYQRAKLDGNALAMTSDYPKSVYVPPPTPDNPTPAVKDSERTDSRTILLGDRFIEFAEITRHGKVREIEVGSAAMGEKLDKPAVNTDLVGASGLSKHISGHGREIVYLRDDDDSDETTPMTTVFRSKDFGTTWQKESQLPGVEVAEGEGTDLAAGPKGWVYVTSLCPKDEASNSTTCNHRQIRPAGAAAFEDMAFVEEFEPMKFAFDEVHDKVYALGVKEGHQYVYESPLAQNKFSRTKLLDATSYTKTAITVDAKGMPRAFEYDTSKQNWVIHRRDEAGKEAPPMYIPLERGSIALAGPRGLIFTNNKGFETNDGGDTWIRVAVNGFARDLDCSDGGCVNGDAHRVGWDLPAVTSQEKIAATTEPTKPATNNTVTPQTPQSAPPMEVICKPSGTGSPITATPGTDMVDGAAADRWASVKHDTDSKISIVVGTKAAVRELPLLAALPKPNAKGPTTPEELRAGERVLSDGVVAARYRFAPRTGGGGYNPVDVELAWWSAVTGRTQHKTLPKVAPFRISRYGFSGTPQIIDGGLLFQGATTDAAYFIHDDGKIDQMTLPKSSSVRQAERFAKGRWVLADSEGGAVQISDSEDNGKTWKQTAWGLDNLWGTVSLISITDKASISYGNSTLPALLFPIDSTLADDPPAPVVIDTVSVDNACDAHVGHHRFTQYIPSASRPVRVRLDNTKGKETWSTNFSPSTRVMHDLAGGKMCTSAYVMSASDSHNYDSQTLFLYREANGTFSGWRFRRNEDRAKGGMLADQLTCK